MDKVKKRVRVPGGLDAQGRYTPGTWVEVDDSPRDAALGLLLTVVAFGAPCALLLWVVA